MTRSVKAFPHCAIVLLLLSSAHITPAQETHKTKSTSTSQTFALTDIKDLTELGVKAEPAEYHGRKAVRLIKQPNGAGIAIIKGAQFQDGIIEADVATKTTTPPAERNPGFIGIAFRVRPDASHYDLFYIRPGNSRSDNQAQRNHSVQYVAEPGFGWEPLRRQWPSIYEAYADLQPDHWTKVKIEVHGRIAKLYLNGAPNPSLVVDGLKGEDLQGGIALWSATDEDAYFTNLKITSAKPEPLQNGGEVAGTWNVSFISDAGNYAGTMKLTRDGQSVTGKWSGAFGSDLPISGTWRNGYVELTFNGTWPDPTGTATATLAGWIDGNSAEGRMKVEGRADGQWTATRQPQ